MQRDCNAAIEIIKDWNGKGVMKWFCKTYTGLLSKSLLGEMTTTSIQ